MIEVKKTSYEKAILVGLLSNNITLDDLNDYLDELQFLAATAGADTLARFYQKRDKPDQKTFVGEGKLQEIILFVKENGIDTIIFDDELNPSQLRNLEKAFKKKIIDRTSLILDIFAQRAQTSYARTQVELAQHAYFLPRLTNLWTHLERQRGGIGMRGPGETEIETDRRIIRDRMALLNKKLQTIDKQMKTQRKGRGRMIRVALVGYTNVGKSTLMNLLSKSEVFAENKLFATLDTTVRKVVLGNLPFLLSDTVGFIRKLPTELVESFKSTLDEVREADLLLHVLDASHRNYQQHYTSVNQILADINCVDKPTFLILNKIDLLSSKKNNKEISLEGVRNSLEMESDNQIFELSASQNLGTEELKKQLYESVQSLYRSKYPYDHRLFSYYDSDGQSIDSPNQFKDQE